MRTIEDVIATLANIDRRLPDLLFLLIEACLPGVQRESARLGPGSPRFSGAALPADVNGGLGTQGADLDDDGTLGGGILDHELDP